MSTLNVLAVTHDWNKAQQCNDIVLSRYLQKASFECNDMICQHVKYASREYRYPYEQVTDINISGVGHQSNLIIVSSHLT